MLRSIAKRYTETRPYRWLEWKIGKELMAETNCVAVMIMLTGMIYGVSKMNFGEIRHHMLLINGSDTYSGGDIRIDPRNLKELMRIAEANLSPHDYLLLPTVGSDYCITVPTSPSDVGKKSAIDNFCTDYKLSLPKEKYPFMKVSNEQYSCLLVDAGQFQPAGNSADPHTIEEATNENNIPYLPHGSYRELLRIASRKNEKCLLTTQSSLASAAMCVLGHSIDTIQFTSSGSVECLTTQQYLNNHIPSRAIKDRGELSAAPSGPVVYYPEGVQSPNKYLQKETALDV